MPRDLSVAELRRRIGRGTVVLGSLCEAFLEALVARFQVRYDESIVY